jgi:TldD protein
VHLSIIDFQELLSILNKKQAKFSDIYYEDQNFFTFTIENNKVKYLKSGSENGIHLRTFQNDKTYSSCSADLSFDFLKKMALDMPSFSEKKFFSNQISAINAIPTITENNPLSSLERNSLIEKFLACNGKIKKMSDKIIQTTLRYSTSLENILILNSDAKIVYDKRIYSRYIIQVVAKDGEIVQTAYEGPGATGVTDILAISNIDELSEKVVKRALTMLEAKPAPTGKMPVVLMGEAGGTMIHEACGHSLEADFIYKETSNLKNMLGKKVASELVTVIDDGTIDGLYGSYSYDDEAIPAQKNVLIENGILKSYMTDRLSSLILGMKPTGNGRRESFRSKPVPRMSNTFVENGVTSSQEIIDSVESGILVKKMGGGQVNITNGDFVFEISEGYLLKNGKQLSPIRGASLIGNGLEALKNIQMVGNDKMFMPGICGKYDHVPVSDAQPTLLIDGLTIGGS